MAKDNILTRLFKRDKNKEQAAITLADKEVHLKYCYATEIAFKTLAEEDIHTFMQESTKAVQAGQMPDIRKAIFLILAAASAYYESKGEEMPISDKDLMNECGPEEFGTALGTVIKLYMEFYHLPGSEAAKAAKQEGSKGKN